MVISDPEDPFDWLGRAPYGVRQLCRLTHM